MRRTHGSAVLEQPNIKTDFDSPKKETIVQEYAWRRWLLSQVGAGTDIILAIQRYRNPLFDIYFKIATFCGDKIFYITLVPLIFWLADPKIGRLFVLLLTTNVYVGNFIKDALSLPRPPSPPVWRSKKENDSGLPSTHSMAAVSQSSFILFYLQQHGVIEMTAQYYLFLVVWVCSICLSRLYLGVHSPPDICAGLIIGSLTSWTWVQYGDVMNNFLMSHPNVPIVVASLVLFSTIFHPRCVNTPSYTRSISVVGLSVGVVIGSWYKQATEYSTITEPLIQFTSPYLKEAIGSLKTSFLWSYLTAELWKTTLRVLFGFFVLNVSFVAFFYLFNLAFFLLFKVPLLSGLVAAFDRTFSRFNVPTFEKIVLEMEDETKKKRRHRRADRPDPTTWSKFVALFLLACLMVDIIPSLFLVMDGHLLDVSS